MTHEKFKELIQEADDPWRFSNSYSDRKREDIDRLVHKVELISAYLLANGLALNKQIEDTLREIVSRVNERGRTIVTVYDIERALDKRNGIHEEEW